MSDGDGYPLFGPLWATIKESTLMSLTGALHGLFGQSPQAPHGNPNLGADSGTTLGAGAAIAALQAGPGAGAGGSPIQAGGGAGGQALGQALVQNQQAYNQQLAFWQSQAQASAYANATTYIGTVSHPTTITTASSVYTPTYTAISNKYPPVFGQVVVKPPEPMTTNLPHVITLGEIIAWRAWRTVNGRFLRSAAMDCIWEPGGVMVGDPESAGVHCWRTMTDAWMYGAQHGQHMAIGKVKVWGLVIENEAGYRAQYARVQSIEAIVSGDRIVDNEQALLDALRANYCPPKPKSL